MTLNTEIDDSWFHHPSRLHGAAHTRRVLAHVPAVLAVVRRSETVSPRQEDLLRLAVLIHDTERTHDGVCRVHGARAAERRRPWVESFLLGEPLPDPDWAAVAFAVRQHCIDGLPPAPAEHRQLAQLLKTCDALDRVRLAHGTGDPAREINVRYLYWPATADLIPAAVALWRADQRRTP